MWVKNCIQLRYLMFFLACLCGGTVFAQDPVNDSEHLNGTLHPQTIRRIILIGPPAAGKGTQGEFISKTFNIPKISTGDLLRQEVAADSDIGQKVKKIMDAGELVSDDIIIDLLKTRISEPDAHNGFILDGFPRTKVQAESLGKLNIDVNYVVELDVPDPDIIKRISGRRVHPGSGRTYHIINNPPKVSGKDDETGEPLIQREDDKQEGILKRLKVYHQQTEPVVAWYKQRAKEGKLQYIKIDGTKDITKIQQDILSKLSN